MKKLYLLLALLLITGLLLGACGGAAPPEPKEEPKEEVDPKDSTIEALRAQVELLSKKATSEEEPKEEEVVVDTTPTFEFSDDEIEEAMLDTGKMKDLLLKVATQATESALQGLPAVVSATVTRQTAVRDVLVKFWGDHPQLEDAKEFVKYNILSSCDK